ncbi:MAG: PmoA family protein [Melioribacteraceae bacterium]|nr:PmoA family protein [Melioribacteraceae bacterium]
MDKLLIMAFNKMIKKIFLIIIVLGLFSFCSDNSNEFILSNIVGDVDSQIEFTLDKHPTNNGILKAQLVEDPNVEFVLQKSPSVFSSTDNSMQNSYSAVIGKSLVEGKYKIVPYTQEPVFSLDDNGNGRLTIIEKGNPVLSYNFGMQLPDSVQERYRRATYIHPIYDSKGNVLTDDFPSDHYHHRGLSWMWPKIFIDSVRYDLWHIYGQNGKLEGIHQVFGNWIVQDIGPVCATIGAKNIWQLDDGKKVMDEWVYVKVYRASDNARAVDIKLIWKAITPIGIEGQTKKGYGGLNLRFAPREETQIFSNLGKEEDSDLKKLPWADQSAKFGGKNYFSGISIFQQKDNNNYPAGWCLRHYGFLGVAWPGIDRYNLNLGETLSLSFRIWIHQGDTEEGKVKSAYEVFENPPMLETQ